MFDYESFVDFSKNIEPNQLLNLFKLIEKFSFCVKFLNDLF